MKKMSLYHWLMIIAAIATIVSTIIAIVSFRPSSQGTGINTPKEAEQRTIGDDNTGNITGDHPTSSDPQPTLGKTDPQSKTGDRFSNHTQHGTSHGPDTVIPAPAAETSTKAPSPPASSIPAREPLAQQGGIRLHMSQECGGFMKFDSIAMKKAIEYELDARKALPLDRPVTVTLVAGYRRERITEDPGTTIRAYAAFILDDGEGGASPLGTPALPCANTVPFAANDDLYRNIERAVSEIASRVAECIKNKQMEGVLL